MEYYAQRAGFKRAKKFTYLSKGESKLLVSLYNRLSQVLADENKVTGIRLWYRKGPLVG